MVVNPSASGEESDSGIDKPSKEIALDNAQYKSGNTTATRKKIEIVSSKQSLGDRSAFILYHRCYASASKSDRSLTPQFDFL